MFGWKVWLAVGMVLTVLVPAGFKPGTANASEGSTVTFTSAEIGNSGSTPQFFQTGNWVMEWSYDCSSYGAKGNFIVEVQQPSGDSTFDPGPNELGAGGNGHDYYTDTGTFSLIVSSECTWTIWIYSNPASFDGSTNSFSSSTIGTTGETPQFAETMAWTMSWSYDCSSYGSQGNFVVQIVPAQGDNSSDTGPNEIGVSGSGTDSYSDAGWFSLDVTSECAWTITTAPAQPPSPAPPLNVGPRCNITFPSGSVVGMAETSDGKGYWIASSNGTVASCGDAPWLGNGVNGTADIAAAPAGNGYWLVTQSGQVKTFGSAVNHGGLAAGTRLSKPIVAMAADPATGGYWLLGGDGGVFSYDAPFFGSTGNIRLNKPAVGMAATLSGRGYYFVASDGGIFAFGKAPFYGSTGKIALNKPVVGMAVDPVTGGYWLDASDGGIFSFRAPFYGSTGNLRLAQPCVGMTAMPDGSGYRFVAADGGIFSFHAPFEGSAA